MRFVEKDTRQLVADEAARLIYDEGYRDYRLAKQKAAARLGATTQSKNQPSNEEIDTALHEYIKLFAADEQWPILRHHREIALEAMHFLRDFAPRLTGAALEGTSGPLSAITLFLSANCAEDVIVFLEEQQIPYQTHERKMRFGQQQEYFPLLRFYADDIEIELLVFPDEGRNVAPISPITGKPAKRADIDKVKALLTAMGTTPDSPT